jgi:hypothetical protein
MTVIRLDAATLAKIQTGNEPVYLADETGRPILRCDPTVLGDLDREPELTEEEWEAIANDPVEYTLEEVWAKIHRGEMF